ncbi:hypothetical protein [Sinorhizobium alkalisoli]|uniref:Uncharacterized protein n=1 Tax=Sinorhizobium alkalisoli TaxID=1752398 RepID=A0A1E3V8B8_9HYPH|nr:hypothetical protein [Sinorhizobium alkalisoli]ODR89715.1 hypothetical protein A8M32_16080 [Sinorhizobium alkalisoli]
MTREEQSRARSPEEREIQPSQPLAERETGITRGTWLLLSALLVGIVIALFAWLPAELTRGVEDVPETTSSTTVEPGQPATLTPPGDEAAPESPETAPTAQ